MSGEIATEAEERPAGCGVQGCLIAAVALFVILMVGIAIVAVIRFSSPPQPRFGWSEAPASSYAVDMREDV